MKLRSTSEKTEQTGWTSAISEDNTLLIPEELLKKLGWKNQTCVAYSTKNGSLIISKTVAS